MLIAQKKEKGEKMDVTSRWQIMLLAFQIKYYVHNTNIHVHIRIFYWCKN